MSKFHNLTIKEIKKETLNAVSILFDIPTELKNEFKFKAGHYLNIKKEIAGEELRRAYSICSAPNSNELRIAVKAVDNGTFSVFATTILKEGDVLEISKPEGKFVLETSATNAKTVSYGKTFVGTPSVWVQMNSTSSFANSQIFPQVVSVGATSCDLLFRTSTANGTMKFTLFVTGQLA